ncbi:MAG: helix-turn-helix transcriptional regulator [Gammaproteobacteria bacterium]|nr:helix-turn-helix transcriptional regulator [Gammaproteobacteria bacterium]
MLSEITGLHRNTTGQVERGTPISMIRLARIAKVFELPTGLLVDGSVPVAPDR